MPCLALHGPECTVFTGPQQQARGSRGAIFPSSFLTRDKVQANTVTFRLTGSSVFGYGAWPDSPQTDQNMTDICYTSRMYEHIWQRISENCNDTHTHTQMEPPCLGYQFILWKYWKKKKNACNVTGGNNFKTYKLGKESNHSRFVPCWAFLGQEDFLQHYSYKSK